MPPLFGIVNSELKLDSSITLYSPIFDSYDHWTQIDERLQKHSGAVFTYPSAIAQDILHMSIHAYYVLSLVETLRSDQTRAQELADLEVFVQGFLSSARSVCDALAGFLSMTCIAKRGQAPETLRKLIRWTKSHPDKVISPGLQVLFEDIEWFEKLRAMRDAFVHFGGHPWIITNGQEFRMVVHAPFRGKAIADEDILHLMSFMTKQILEFMDGAGNIINSAIELPPDRHKSRKLLGLRLSSLEILRSGRP